MDLCAQGLTDPRSQVKVQVHEGKLLLTLKEDTE